MYVAYNTAGKLKKDPTVNDDSLERFSKSVNWDAFIPVLDTALPRKTGVRGGRPSFNNLYMFKVLIVKWLYRLSFDQTEIQIYDRAALKEFLGCGKDDLIPDAKTIWLYKDRLSKSGAVEKLADMLNKATHKNRYVKDLLTNSKNNFIDEFSSRSERQNARAEKAETTGKQSKTVYAYNRNAETVSANDATIAGTAV